MSADRIGNDLWHEPWMALGLIWYGSGSALAECGCGSQSFPSQFPDILLRMLGFLDRKTLDSCGATTDKLSTGMDGLMLNSVSVSSTAREAFSCCTTTNYKLCSLVEAVA